MLVSTEEIAKFWYENLVTCPAIADMGIYLKSSGPGFFDADFYQRSHAPFIPAVPGGQSPHFTLSPTSLHSSREGALPPPPH